MRRSSKAVAGGDASAQGPHRGLRTATVRAEAGKAGSSVKWFDIRGLKPGIRVQVSLPRWPSVFVGPCLAGLLLCPPALADVIRCLPPSVPMTDLPALMLQHYRAEIAAEFESYFRVVSDYLACLDAERTRAFDEARGAATTHARLLASQPGVLS